MSFSFRFGNQKALIVSARAKIKSLVTEHIQILAIKREKGIKVDDYGVVDARQWGKECQYFFDKVIRPALTVEEWQTLAAAGLSQIANEMLEEPTRLENKRLEELLRSAPSVPSAKVASNRSRPFTSSDVDISTGLIIRGEPLSKILSGLKTWEMRSRQTTKRETIALIQKGSKFILGVADIIDCLGRLSRREMVLNYQKHQIQESRLDNPEESKLQFAWVLTNVRRLKYPVTYPVKSGPVIFVSLDEITTRAVLDAL